MFSRKSSKFLAYFTILISVGTLGFYVIGGDEWSLIDSFYMTLFTMTTVGFGEVQLKAGGVYLYQLRAGKFTQTRKMLLLK
jgi:hypothetical protein